MDLEIQTNLMIALYGLNFTSPSLEIGGLAEFLVASETLKAVAGVDLARMTTAENFFSIDTLFNMLRVFQAEDVEFDSAFGELIKGVTTVEFFAYTQFTFTFDVFVDILLEVDIVLEVIIAKFEVALGYSVCLGPGVVVNAFTGTCMCETDLTLYDADVLGCVCLPGSGLKFEEVFSVRMSDDVAQDYISLVA